MIDLKQLNLSDDLFASIPSLGSSEDLFSSLPQPDQKQGLARDLALAVALARQLEQIQQTSGMDKWFSKNSPFSIDDLPKHKAFFAAGADYPERMFLAANRVGKSIAGAYEAACHATGIYPEWWTGKRFDTPTDGWVVGPDARTVRDTLQLELLGRIGEWGTGMLPASALGTASSLQGTTGAIDTVQIRHVSGGWSTIGFKNYKQDIQAFMGVNRHWILLDEEAPMEVYNECNIRTAAVKGIMLSTFTPLQGLTRLVINFCKNATFLVGARPILALTKDQEEGDELVGSNRNKAVIQAGWDDAPWLDADTKQRLLEDTPEYLRDARSKGIPSMGSGNVFSTPIEQVICDPFVIPDNWPRMYALDVGWNRTAAVWAALDPNSDTVYLYDEHYKGQEEPFSHAYSIKSRGEQMRGVIDPAARGRSQIDGTQLLRLYQKLGLHLSIAKNERESGIAALSQRFSTGKLKVFKTLTNFQKEYMLYRRDQRGRVIDEDDHLMDCARYVINNMNRMSSFVNNRGPALNVKPRGYDV